MATHLSITTARSFLDLMEARKIKEAGALLASDFLAVFPGNRRYTTLEDFVESSKSRYRDVRKSYDLSLHVPADAEGIETVIFYGTLSGFWVDGSRFDGIRFTDRFRLRDGLIVEQQVWNDMGEERIRLGIA